MDNLANIFSVLALDAEDDTDQITTLVAAKEESNSSKSDDTDQITTLVAAKEESNSSKSAKDGKNGESSGKETSLKDGKKGESSGKENSLKDGKKGESSGKENSRKDGKKGESSGKENSLENGRLNQESLASSSRDYKMPLVWIDLEMTGLDVATDRILEIACVLTDGKLTKSIEGPDFVVSQTKECMDKMGEWCREHHAASGLTERVLQSTISERDAEKQVIEFVKKHVGSDIPLLAGNSIYVDFLFLKKYMPDLAAIFPHVLVDVSSIMALCIRWFPRERKKAPQKEKRHRAMDDIKESISELKYYKESIFKSPKYK